MSRVSKSSLLQGEITIGDSVFQAQEWSLSMTFKFTGHFIRVFQRILSERIDSSGGTIDLTALVKKLTFVSKDDKGTLVETAGDNLPLLIEIAGPLIEYLGENLEFVFGMLNDSIVDDDKTDYRPTLREIGIDELAMALWEVLSLNMQSGARAGKLVRKMMGGRLPMDSSESSPLQPESLENGSLSESDLPTPTATKSPTPQPTPALTGAAGPPQPAPVASKPK